MVLDLGVSAYILQSYRKIILLILLSFW